MYTFPSDPKKIRARIRSYERKLVPIDGNVWTIDDGYGKRFLLAPLYLLADDLQGCMKSLEWYKNLFTEDMVEPMHHLCWTLAFYKDGQLDAARKKLWETMLANLYLIPSLWGEERAELGIWHGCNYAEPSFLEWIPPEIYDLWDATAVAWAKKEYESAPFRRLEGRYIEIAQKLKDTPRGEGRSALCEEARRLERDGVDAVILRVV